MNLDLVTLRKLIVIASRAALEAGALIQDYSQRDFVVQRKEGCESLATQVVTEVDELSQGILLKHLVPTLEPYDLALLTEEQEDDGSRFQQDYFWCIDPLDGTLPFAQRMPGYAVSIALVSSQGQPVLGVIYDPVDGVLWHAIDGVGVFRNHEPWAPAASESPDTTLRFYCDCSFDAHPQREAMVSGMERVAQRMGMTNWEIEIGGGAVMNALSVLAHAPACYFKVPKMTAGGGSIWDFASTAAVYAAVGRPVTNFSGGRLDLNREDSTFMNHEGVMYATSDELADAVRACFSDV